MKLKFRKQNLMESINIVSRAIPSRTTNPILECILFDGSGDSVRLIANDMELGVETVCSCDIEEKGRIAIDAKLISEIIRKCDSAETEITIEADQQRNITITCDSSVYNIQGRDPDEFPYLEYIEKINYISISQFTFKEVIRQTAFSAAVNDNNKMMGGEYIEVNGNRARFTTLDGHRVSIRNVEMKDDYGNFSAIAPVRSLGEVSKIISGDNDKELIIYFSKNNILFEFDNTKVLTRVIGGEYFRIAHMISRDYETMIRINKNRLIGTIDRSMIFIKESDHKPIILKITDDDLNISIKSSFGAMDGDIECEKEGADLKIAFNPKFLIDALRAIDDEEVELYFTNAKAPCFIRDADEKYIYLILPVNFVE